MTAKQWLMRAWSIDRELTALMNAKQEAYERITSVTAKIEGNTVSGTKDPHKYESYVSFTDEIVRKMKALYDVKLEIMNTIGQVNDPKYRAVLTERCINLHTLEQTAVNLHYSFQHVCRLQAEAFERAKRFIPKDEIV